MEKDELLSLPTTQHLLAMSFYQADLEFREASFVFVTALSFIINASDGDQCL